MAFQMESTVSDRASKYAKISRDFFGNFEKKKSA